MDLIAPQTINHSISRRLLLCCMLVLSGCGGGSGSSSGDNAGGDPVPAPIAPVDNAVLSSVVAEQQLVGDPSVGRSLPSIDDPLAQLGMKLFFSKALSGQLDTACVSCHHPFLAGGDALALPIGVDADDPDFIGPGRKHSSSGFDYDGGPTVPRNSPSTFNVALYDKSIFHDGRIEPVGAVVSENGVGQPIRTPDVWPLTADSRAVNMTQAQALFPVTSEEEMRAKFLVQDGDEDNNRETTAQRNQQVRNALAQRLVDQTIPNTWLQEFQTAFNSNADAATLITFANISLALGEYERSQVFVDTAWKKYVNGDKDAIGEAEKRGALLFFRSVADGGAGCSSCHSGDFFTDEEYHVIAVPQIGRGKENGPTGDDDFGRFRETWISKDKYAFRTPTLLNVEMMAPYGHDGAYATLTEIVSHHLDPAKAIDSFDFSLPGNTEGVQNENAEANTRLALAQLIKLQDEGLSKLATVDLDRQQIDDLVAFLKTLTDSCVKSLECLAKWVPAKDSVDPDNLRLIPSNEF